MVFDHFEQQNPRGLPARRFNGLGLDMLIWGALVLLGGCGLLGGQGWARWFAIFVVSLNFFAQLGFLGNSQFPLWSLTAVGLSLVVLFALTVRWSESLSETV